MPTTQIVCLVDRSGSMDRLRDDAIGGFNAFLETQRALPGDAALTLVLFDHEYEALATAVPLDHVAPLTRESYVPRGSTALLDAIGRAVTDAQRRTDPDTRVLVCILTDGAENASTDYTRDQVRTLLDERRADGWSVEFLAAGPDAFSEAGGLGLAAAQVMPDSAGIAHAFSVASEAVTAFRRS